MYFDYAKYFIQILETETLQSILQFTDYGVSVRAFLYSFGMFLPIALESGIDVAPGINVAPGTFGTKPPEYKITQPSK